MKTLMLLMLTLAGSVSAQVPFERLLNANKEPQNWLTYSGTTMSQRYSLLTQITPDNAKNLEQAWSYQATTNEKFEATPLVADGIMYTVCTASARATRRKGWSRRAWRAWRSGAGQRRGSRTGGSCTDWSKPGAGASTRGPGSSRSAGASATSAGVHGRSSRRG